MGLGYREVFSGSKMMLAGVVGIVGFCGALVAINPNLNPFIEAPKPSTSLSLKITNIRYSPDLLRWDIIFNNNGPYKIRVMESTSQILEGRAMTDIVRDFNAGIDASVTLKTDDFTIPPYGSNVLHVGSRRPKVDPDSKDIQSRLLWAITIFEDGPSYNRFVWNQFNCVRIEGSDVKVDCSVGENKDGAIVPEGPPKT